MSAPPVPDGHVATAFPLRATTTCCPAAPAKKRAWRS